MYQDREDAALALIHDLLPYKGEDGVVLAIPRGGVPIGFPIALALDFQLDIILSKKIGHPDNPDLAIGAVSMLDVSVNPKFGMSHEYIDQNIKRIRQELKEKYRYLTGREESSIELWGKTVILVDDGIATGSTMEISIDLVRRNQPGKIIVACPVISPRAMYKLVGIVDKVVCPLRPQIFYAVGQFYQNFEQVTDQEVISLLQQANRAAGAS